MDENYSYPICYAAVYNNPLKPLEKSMAIIEFLDFNKHTFVDSINMTEEEVREVATKELEELIMVYKLTNLDLPKARNLDDIEYFGIMKLQIDIPKEKIEKQLEELENENN